jgi:hypothetical protein
MRYQEPNVLSSVIGRTGVVIIMLLVVTGITRAQGPPAGAGPPPVNSPRLESSERNARENALRGAEIDATTEKRNQQRLEAAIVQVKQDFTHLQVVRNEIAHNLVARKPLDYNLISDQTRDINKAASRLKIYMMPRPVEDKEKEQKKATELNIDDMTAALVRLCKLIDSFVENPALKNAVDAQQLDKVKADKARADSDLLTIIDLSENLQKKAESLTTAPK